MLPGESAFYAGQDVRIGVTDVLGDTVKAFFNYTDQAGYDIRVYEYVAAFGTFCENYNLNATDPSYKLVHVIDSQIGFGLSVADYMVNRTYVPTAFSTFTAPHHSVQFIICYRRSKTRSDLTARNYFPRDGEWELFRTKTQDNVFRSRPTETFYSLPETPTPNQFVVVKLFSFGFNFTTPVNCSSDTTKMQVFGTNGTYAQWECLKGDAIKIVPRGKPCTYETKYEKMGHPYLGTYYVKDSGELHHEAALGLFEGAEDGGVGILSSSMANPFTHGTAASDATMPRIATDPSIAPSAASTASVYLKMPKKIGQYEVCFSSMEQRAVLKKGRTSLGPVSQYPHDVPLWKKLYPCDELATDGCRFGSSASDVPYFEVYPEDITWSTLDVTPHTWGTIRVQAPSKVLNRHPMSAMESDYLTTVGGDWIRIVEDFNFATDRPALDLQGVVGVQVGSFSPVGCWPPYHDFLATRLEQGAFAPFSSTDLGDSPYNVDGLSDLKGAEDTYFTLRMPQFDSKYYVCYKKEGWTAWRMLAYTEDNDIPTMWQRLYPFYPYALASPAPLVPGQYVEDKYLNGKLILTTPSNIYNNISLEWTMNDTRSGMWGPLHIEERYQRIKFSAKKSTALRHTWEWQQYNTAGRKLSELRGTSLRIIPQGFPCDHNSNATDQGRWAHYDNGGEEECHWRDITPTNQYCFGSHSDSESLNRITFYIQLPVQGDYDVCVRIGALNWYLVKPPPRQFFNLEHLYTPNLQVVPPTPFWVKGVVETETDTVLLISGYDAFATGHGGDFARLVYNREPCDLTPETWLRQRGEMDTVLSLQCDDALIAAKTPCTDPRGDFDVFRLQKNPTNKIVPFQVKMREKDMFRDDIHSRIIAYVTPKEHNITYHPVKIEARLCVKSALTPNWFWQDVLTVPHTPLLVVPATSTELLAGVLESFEVFFPTGTLAFPFHAKLVPHDVASANSHCQNIAAGIDESPYFLSQTFGAHAIKGQQAGQEGLSFTIDTPLREGEYWLCISMNVSTVWHRSLYTVRDNGMRWYVATNENPVNQGSSSIFLQRCRGQNCRSTDTFDTNAGADRAKLVQWDLPCATYEHVGLEGGGLDGHTDLGPSNGPQKFASFDMTFPPVPEDSKARYKVCVYTAMAAKGGAKVWMSLKEDTNAVGQQFIHGMHTEPAIFGEFGVDPRLAPLTGARKSGPPSALAGALTAYVNDMRIADPRVVTGLWLTPTVPHQAISRELVNEIQFKLVPWPTCAGLEESSCRRSGWCYWDAGCKDTPGIVFDCRSSGSPSSVIPSPSCVESVGTCPMASADLLLSKHAPKGSVGLVFHLPEPGRYLACGKLPNGPWRFVLSQGSETLIVEDPRIQMDPGKVSFDAPGANLTVFDIHGVDGVSLGSWCAEHPLDYPNCKEHFQPAMRKDWVTVVNDTQVCMPSLYPGESGWYPMKRIGKALSAVEPGVVGFRLPPQDPTPSGQYRVCVLKASYAQEALGGMPVKGALSQPGVSYTMWNRAPPSLGTGGSTFLLTAGMPDELAVRVTGEWDTSKRFHIWDPAVGYVYEGINAVRVQPTKSVPVVAGSLITIKLTAMSRGLVAGVGTFPVYIETCMANDWNELNCDVSTPNVVKVVNVPSSSGCNRNDAAGYEWDEGGGTQFMVSGELTYTLRLLSICNDTAFQSGCGVKFVTGNLRSKAVWFSVERRKPDGIVFNGVSIKMQTAVQHICWHRQMCVLNFEATTGGLREFAPNTTLHISLQQGLAAALSRVTGLYEVTSLWDRGGTFVYSFRPYLLAGNVQEVTVRVAIDTNSFIDINIIIRSIASTRLHLEDLVPLDVTMRTNGIHPPAPMWMPAMTESGPFVLQKETQSSAWESQPGMYIMALAPYELRFEMFDVADVPLQNLNAWKADLSFESQEAQRRNKILSVPPNLDDVTSSYTTPQMVPPYRPLTPLLVPGTNNTWSVRFRLFSNIGCQRLTPCKIFLTLTNGTTTVTASFKVSVRVRATTLKILAPLLWSAIHRGLGVSVIPGTFDNSGAWMPDEYNHGDVYALMADSSDGVANKDGRKLADTVDSTPAKHSFAWIDPVTTSVFDIWGARWTLSTTRPCTRCALTFHTTSGLGPTSDTMEGGTLVFSLTDETFKVVCEAKTIGYSIGALSSEEFNVTITPTTRNGVPTNWADWPVEIDPVTDFLQDGEPVLTGLLSLHHKGSTGVIHASMVDGVATISGLFVKIPENYQGGSYSIRAKVNGSTDSYHCSTSIKLQRSTRSQGFKTIAVHLVDGGQALCADPESLLGCGSYTLDTEQTLRLKIRYYGGTTLNDLLTDVTDRDVTIRIKEDIVKWENCEGVCPSRAVELTSVHPPLLANENGKVTIPLSQGSSVVKFERRVTGGRSAPGGRGFISLVQQSWKGFTTPVRETVFEICDRESIEGELSASASFIPCREIRMWIRPSIPVQTRDTMIVGTSLTTPSLRYGVPGCGTGITNINISIAVYYIWGDVRYVAYDVPFEFAMRHGSGQTLVQVVGSSLGASRPEITVDNGLRSDMVLSDLLTQGQQTVEFSFYGLYSKASDTFRVSVRNMLDAKNAPKPTETANMYGWPPRSSDTYPAVSILDTPTRDDECFQRRRFPRIRDHYQRWEKDPGKGWAYGSNKAAMVGLPFPLQVQVKGTDGGRAWSFLPSPVVLRSKVANKGCNDGGNASVYSMKTSAGDVVDLKGDMTDFVLSPSQYSVTQGGQVTLWVALSTPCQECVIELALCYQSALTLGLDTCHTLGGSAAEERNGPMVSQRTMVTQPFTVLPLKTKAVAITKQTIPLQPDIQVGTPFSVSVEPVLEFAGDWMMHPPASYKAKTTDIVVEASVRVKWMDSADGMLSRHVRYSNGGFIRLGQTTACETSRDALITASARADSTLTNLVHYPSAAEQADMAVRGDTNVWWAQPFNFAFIRSCSHCEVWIHARLLKGGTLVSEWQAPLRNAAGNVMVYQVSSCGTRWIWGGEPPRTVRRRKPFGLSVWRADSNQIPSWEGAVPVSVGKGDPNVGGMVLFTSTLESQTPPTLTSVAGVANFRMEATRSCYQCVFHIGNLYRDIMVVSNATQVIAIPKATSSGMHSGGDFPTSGIWSFEMYVADDLGDRAYVGGPTFVQRLLPYQQAPVPHLDVTASGNGRDEQMGRVLFVSTGRLDVLVVVRSPQPRVAYGRYMQNGVPVDVNNGTLFNCKAQCDRPGTMAVYLEGQPNKGFELSHLTVGSMKLPVSLRGSGVPPVLTWSVPPSAIIFDDITPVKTYSGVNLHFKMIVIGGIPGTKRNDHPLNVTYHISNVPFETPPAFTFTCNIGGFWKYDGVEYQWDSPVVFHPVDGRFSVDVTPFIGAQSTATCKMRILSQQPHLKSFKSEPEKLLVPPQDIQVAVQPDEITAPTQWSWDDTGKSTTTTKDIFILVGLPTTIVLYGHGVGRRVQLDPSVAATMTLSFLTIPDNCFTSGPYKVVTTPSGPTIQWEGVVNSIEICKIQSVLGLPVGINRNSLVITASRRQYVDMVALKGIDSVTGAGDPAVLAGTDLFLELQVKDSLGVVVMGDSNTTVNLNYVRCFECCRRVNPQCRLNHTEVFPPSIPLQAQAHNGVIKINIRFHTPTQPFFSAQASASLPTTVPHVPWLINITTPGLVNRVPFLPAIYVAVVAESLAVEASFGTGMLVFPQVVSLPWVVGFPFGLRMTARDMAVPPNVPEGVDQGATAKVQLYPVAIPCKSADDLGWVSCPTCREGGEWIGTNSRMWATCISKGVNPFNPNYGTCDLVPLPGCNLIDWELGLKRITDSIFTLKDGTATIPKMSYTGAAEVVSLLLSSDELLPHMKSYTRIISINMQRITSIVFSSPFVSSCSPGTPDPIKSRLCAIAGDPFIAPPPIEPIRNPDNSWFKPEKGLMQIQPSDEVPIAASMMDIALDVLDESGQLISGDTLTEMSLDMKCLDPDISRVERFYMGYVNTDLLATPLISRVATGGFIGQVVNGRVIFPRIGFHGYCSRTIVFAHCITSNATDTLGTCKGLYAELEPFEVGSVDMVLDAPVFPPLDEVPAYQFPAVQLTLGQGMTCAEFAARSTVFLFSLKNAILSTTAVKITDMKVHAGCEIPQHRLKSGILSIDYGDPQVCCPQLTDQGPPPDPDPNAGNVTVTLTLDQMQTTAAPLTSYWLGALTAGDCDAVNDPQYLYDPARLSDTAAVRCCSPDGSSCVSEGSNMCLPENEGFQNARLLCADLKLRLCTAAEITTCCGSSCSPGMHAWVSDAALSVDNYTECRVLMEEAYLPRSTAGYDSLHFVGTLEACTAACCSLGKPGCVGFTRSLHVAANETSDCWLKKPHPASVREASTSYLLHLLYDERTPPPPVPTQTVPCSQRDEVDCAVDGNCVWDVQCTDTIYCSKNHHVVGGECTPCGKDMTRPAGDEVHGNDTLCIGCDGNLDSNATLDRCGICNGDDSSCKGCDGVVNSLATYNPCGICNVASEGDNSTTCDACAVLGTDAVGTRVRRGPDWVYGKQDHHGEGTITGMSPCEGGMWATVLWDGVYDAATSRYVRNTNSYRAGCDGLYDISDAKCVTKKCPHPSCDSATGTTRDTCEGLGCLWSVTHSLCTGSLAAKFLCPCSASTRLECSALSQCSFVSGTCVEKGMLANTTPPTSHPPQTPLAQ